MEAFFAAFLFGTFWWWFVVVVWAFAEIIALDKDSGAWATAWLVLFFCFAQFLGKVNIVGSILENPLRAILYVVGYVAVGVGWSFMKWWLHVSEKAEDYKKERSEYLKRLVKNQKNTGVPLTLKSSEITENTPVPEKYRQDWSRSRSYTHAVPKASENKERITTWIIYWPLSMLWSLIRDFIHRMIQRLVKSLQKWYDGITKRAFRGVTELD
jgi:hypothetical protein